MPLRWFMCLIVVSSNCLHMPCISSEISFTASHAGLKTNNQLRHSCDKPLLRNSKNLKEDNPRHGSETSVSTSKKWTFGLQIWTRITSTCDIWFKKKQLTKWESFKNYFAWFTTIYSKAWKPPFYRRHRLFSYL